MFMIVIIYFSNIFQDNHIFLLWCLHSSVATLKTIIVMLANRNSFIKSIAYLEEYLIKVKNRNSMFGCLSLVYFL